MVFGVFAVLSPASTAEFTDMPKIAGPERMDAGPALRDKPVDAQAVLDAMSESTRNMQVSRDYYNVNDTMEFYDVISETFLEVKKRAEGNHCEVWVATNLSFPSGDSRNADPSVFNITYGDVDYIRDQFDNHIYDIEATYFGEPGNLTGDNALFKDWGFDYAQNDNGTKVIIMILNIEDENYYDSSYPYYIAGYFSPTTKLYYDRNIIHIDCWDWANRTGPSSLKPYLYEGVVAHEFQHLLHDIVDPYETTWLNEGLSMYAEFLTNYSNIWDSIYRFLYTPDNGLVDWGDQGDINILADYGNSMLFMIYLNDHFGGAEFISKIFNSTLQGMESITSVLQNTTEYSDWTFDDAFYAFRLANLIHADHPGDGWYNYDNISWSDPAAMELYNGCFNYYDVDDGYVWASDYFGDTWTYDGDNTGQANVGSYGTDYFVMDPSSSDEYLGLKFLFDGWDEVPEGWEIIEKTTIEEIILYEEDFNHGGAYPSGWTTWGEGPDYWPWIPVSMGDSDYAIYCNSDDPGMGTDITEWFYMSSISFDASSASNLFLEFYLDYNYYDGDEYGKVLINDGYGFTEVATYTSDITGTQLIDISTYAGEDYLQIAFKYHGTWDWWMLVDELKVYGDVEIGTGDYCWYSGEGDLVDYELVGSTDLTGVDEATLAFDTWFEIEEFWDFGFVQVSTDGGATWESLENEWTTNETDPNALPLIVENVPGLTGISDGWQSMSFNLSSYAGQEILFQFRYITDWAYTDTGWMIDNVTINGVLIDNASDVIGLAPVFPNTDFIVTIYCPAAGTMPAMIFDLNLNHDTETTLRSFHSVAQFYDHVFVLVSPTVGMADYMFGMMNSP